MQRPIGVFDSGVGGLSVLDALVRALPNEHFIYVGDTAHMPYGERSSDEIKYLVSGIEDFLLNDCHAKMLVVACNTSAGILADHWQQDCSVPVIEPVLPITSWLNSQKEKPYKTIGLLATQGTINSGRYQAALAKSNMDVVSVACTGFAKLVEDNQFHTPSGKALIKTFLEPLVSKHVDAIILGCTHYPFAEDVLDEIWQALSPTKPVKWLNPADWMASAVNDMAMCSGNTVQKSLVIDFYVTGSTQKFDIAASQLNFHTLKLTPATPLVLPALIANSVS